MNTAGTLLDLDTIHLFPLIDCAISIVQSKSSVSMKCPKCTDGDIPMAQLVPDLLLTDLRADLHVHIQQLTFDPETDLVGRGAEGSVYRAVLDGKLAVAVKQSILVQTVRHIKSGSSASSLNSGLDSSDSHNSTDSSDSNMSVEAYLRNRVQWAAVIDNLHVLGLLYEADLLKK